MAYDNEYQKVKDSIDRAAANEKINLLGAMSFVARTDLIPRIVNGLATGHQIW